MLFNITTIKKVPKEVLLKIIQTAKDYLKQDPVVLKMCQEYNVSPEILDQIPIKFGDLDVSAKTSKGIITLNYKLLENGKFKPAYSYLVHEVNHFLQQTQATSPTPGSDQINYLDNELEEDSFQRQLEFIDREQGEQAMEQYLNNLLDHHQVPIEERAEKKEELTPHIK